MSTYTSVVISPETTTRPVFTSVSHATRPVGSSAITASSTPSEIWSAILSGWPSVTDSEVNRNSLSERGCVVMRRPRVHMGRGPSVDNHHRAVSHPFGGADRHDDARGARGGACAFGSQPLQRAGATRARRPAHGLGDGSDVLGAVGRAPARGRELRGLRVVVSLSRRGTGPVPVRARDP